MEIVSIFGVGLIGGSFALALRQAGFQGRILGVSSETTLRRALDAGVIDEPAHLADAASRSDLIYLAQPIGRILEVLPQLNPHVHPHTLVTDAGSTKAEIVRQAAQSLTRCRFLGGHPIAGKESRGVEAADPSLFQNRTYVFTPAQNSDLENEPARILLSWVRRIGSHVAIMSTLDHDLTLAYTSHLPQLASTALSTLLAGQPESVRHIFGPALLDTTRLALSPFEIWADILSTNAQQIDSALAGYISVLERLRRNLADPSLAAEFRAAAEFAAHLRRER